MPEIIDRKKCPLCGSIKLEERTNIHTANDFGPGETIYMTGSKYYSIVHETDCHLSQNPNK